VNWFGIGNVKSACGRSSVTLTYHALPVDVGPGIVPKAPSKK